MRSIEVPKELLDSLKMPFKDSDYNLSDLVETAASFDEDILVCRFRSEKRGGPYLLLWVSDCERLMSWTTGDDAIDGHCYRLNCQGSLADESLSSETFRDSYLSNFSEELSPAFFLLPKNEEVRDVLTEWFDLDADLCRGVRSDRDITGSEFAKLLEEYAAVLVPFDETKKETKMTTTASTTSKINSITNRVKSAGMGAAEFQAGKAMNVAVMKMIKPKLPMMLRGYADHAAAPAVIALAVALASEFVPESASKEKLLKASDLMLNAAVMEGADKLLNIEAIIDGVLSQMPKEAAELIQG